MAKAYWVATYRSVSDPDALAAYARLSGPAIAGPAGASWCAGCRRRSTRPGSGSAPW